MPAVGEGLIEYGPLPDAAQVSRVDAQQSQTRLQDLSVARRRLLALPLLRTRLVLLLRRRAKCLQRVCRRLQVDKGAFNFFEIFD